MKGILLVGDPHFKISNSIETSQFSQETVDYIFKNKDDLEFVVILGDVLDTHEKIHIQPLCRAVKFIKKISKIILVYVMIGNHDRINNNVFLTDEHPFSGLKRFENIIVVDKVLNVDNFIFVPYVSNGRFNEALETIDFKHGETKAIFAHQEFKGCKMGAMISEDGDVWPEHYPPVFSGHIHEFQRPQQNIMYPGTPFQHGFGDNPDKFLLLLKFNSSSDWSYGKVYLNIFKKKQFTMHITKFEDFIPPDNCILKIVLEGDFKTSEKILSKKSIRDKIKKFNISYKIKNPDIKLHLKDKKYSKNTFLENLKQRIEISDEKIKKCFSEIFN